jgi:hypothetical protein
VTLYFLVWDNGLEFDDHETALLGVYATKQQREQAREHYRGADCWPFNSEGCFEESEIETDAHLVEVKRRRAARQ